MLNQTDRAAILGCSSLKALMSKVFNIGNKSIFHECKKNIRHPEQSEGSNNIKDSSVVSLPLNDVNDILTKRKFAFTLAEVLITIGVIGVVAAITIPNLITNYQKTVTVNRLKQVFSQLGQALKQAESQNGDIGSWEFEQNAPVVFENYLAPQMLIAEKKSSNNLKSEGIIYKRIYGSGDNLMDFTHMPIKIYTTMNGTDMIILDRKITSTLSVYVDINGRNTKPNQIGKDLFGISINSKGVYFWGTYNSPEFTFENEPNADRDVLIGKKNALSGTGSTYYPCSNKSANYHGMWCGRLIQLDGWQISKDYPW